MRICSKCGRSNSVTRKYCVRCGASLIQAIKKKEPKEVARIPEAAQATTRETTSSVGTQKEAPTPKPEVSVTSGKLVRPSMIQQNRVRTAERHGGKTELEKAKEAFNRADQASTEEGYGGIVEPRMLRASEVRELMASMANLQDDAMTQAPEPIIQPELPPQKPPEAGIPPGVTPQPIERDITSTEPILASQSAPVSKPPPKAKPRMEPQGSEIGISPMPPPRAMPALQAKEPIAKAAPPPIAPEPVIEAAVNVPTQEVTNITGSPISKIQDPEYLNDAKLGPMLLDHKIIHNKLKQIESELGSIRSEQDTEVQKHHNAAEAKKIHYESLKGQLDQAKQELIDAGKEYYAAENRRKKEVGGREKELKKLQKSISKSEAAIEKRVRELDTKKANLV